MDYECVDCGARFKKDRSFCNKCGSNDVQRVKDAVTDGVLAPVEVPVDLAPIVNSAVSVNAGSMGSFQRLPSGLNGVDSVLGGGIVPGSVTLLAGTPGAGKSTLLATFAQSLAEQGMKVLYYSGEESVEQISLRHKRLNCVHENIEIISSTSGAALPHAVGSRRWELVIVDSIQTMANGQRSMVDIAHETCNVAHAHGVPVVMVGHYTKDNRVGGPQALMHIVDVVLTLSVFGNEGLRVLRQDKNRYGDTSVSALFQHQDHGFVEVIDPSGILFSRSVDSVVGVGPTILVEGSRPILGEIQSLVTEPLSANAQFVASGINGQKARVITASLSNAGLPTFGKDVYIESGGGMSIRDTGADLAVAASVISSTLSVSVPVKTVFIGEVLLTSEVRKPSHYDARVREARRLGCRVVGPGDDCDMKVTSVRELIMLVKDGTLTG